MAAPKNKTRDQREEQLARISELHAKCWPAYKIAENLRISRQTVQRDLAIIRQRYLEAQISNVATRRAMEVARINLAEKEAWAGWDASKEDAEVRTQKIRKGEPGAEGMPVGATIRSEGRCGNPAYLRLVLECIRDRRKLQGTDRPERSSTDDYSGMTDDEIDARIAHLDRLEALERGETGPEGSS